MIDEDAFGVLFSYYELEDDEYGTDERAEFVERFEGFERAALAVVSELSLPGEPHVVCLGHAVYVEFRDEGPAGDLLRVLRQASSRLVEAGYVNATALTHGGRWVPPDEGPELSVSEPKPRIVRLSRPSEPLRRALEVEALSRSSDAVEGWGPGVYVDTDALEALGKTPKNAPTILHTAGAQFFRIPALPVEAR
jgi:hypothetical protein